MSLTAAQAPENLYRLGTHAEAEYFRHLKSAYDGMIVNANLVEVTPKATASFLATQGKPFLIDPMTYAFGLNPAVLRSNSKRGGMKRSFAALSRQYGSVISGLAGKTPIGPIHFTGNAEVAELAQAVVNYQVHRFDEIVKELREADPTAFSGLTDLPLASVIAPYFYIDEVIEAGLSLNARLVEAAVAVASGMPVYAMVCLAGGILSDMAMLDTIAAECLKTRAAGFLFWLDDITERTAGPVAVRNLIAFVRALSRDNRPVYNAYGGCLSALLFPFGLQGFSHGLGYGERRSVMPVTGGSVPPPKYYVPPLCDRYNVTDVLFIAQAAGRGGDFHSEICGCAVCRRVLAGNTDRLIEFGRTREEFDKNGRPISLPTAESIKLCRLHYMLAKRDEVARIRADWDAAVARLNDAHGKYSNALGGREVTHLAVWHKQLTAADQTR